MTLGLVNPKVSLDPLNAEVIAKRLTERAETFIHNGKGCKPSSPSFPISLSAKESSSPASPTAASAQTPSHPSGHRAPQGFLSRHRVGSWYLVIPVKLVLWAPAGNTYDVLDAFPRRPSRSRIVGLLLGEVAELRLREEVPTSMIA